MGKMKALALDIEENHVDEQEDQDQDVVFLQQEAHYHHVINDFVYLVQVHGWTKVIGDLRSKMGQFTW
jgi:hypothetical protein